MSGRAGNVVTFALLAGYVAGRISVGGPVHATPLDLIAVLLCIGAGFLTMRLVRR